MKEFAGKIALITGGGSEIGRATAIAAENSLKLLRAQRDHRIHLRSTYRRDVAGQHRHAHQDK
jgi:NAD(P)-dependent dehydrogenase (short-subunit alcohol dehydrogenase family)